MQPMNPWTGERSTTRRGLLSAAARGGGADA